MPQESVGQLAGIFQQILFKIVSRWVLECEHFRKKGFQIMNHAQDVQVPKSK